MSTKGSARGQWSKAGSIPELIAAAVGAALVFSAIGYMSYTALSSTGSPPVLEVAVDSIVARGEAFAVEVSVANRGDRTAARVNVQGALHTNGQAAETSEVTLDYVPAGAVRRITLLFTRDPRRHRLEIRAIGHDHP